MRGSQDSTVIRSLTIAAIAALAVSPAAALDRTKTPVTVDVAPAMTVAGTSVAVRGTSVPLGEQKTVEIRIRPPQGDVESFKVDLDDEHAFSLVYDNTASEGSYTVVAISPDGKNNARTSFEVVRPVVLRERETARLKGDLDTFAATTSRFESTLTAAPASVARDELIERTAETGRQLDQASASVEDLSRALEALEQAASADDSESGDLAAELDDLYGQFSAAADTVEQRRIDFERQMARFDYDHTLCDGLHYVREAWSTMTAALSAAKTLAKSVADIAQDQLIDAGVKAGEDAMKSPDDSPVEDLTRNQALSLAKDLGTGSFNIYNSTASALQGLVGAGLAEVFSLACVEYLGDFSAYMGADIFEGEQIYWQHQTWLKGKIRVRHENPRGGITAAIAVTGEIEGVANKFEVEEALYILQPGIERDVLLRWTIPPVGGLFLDDAGFFRPLTPYSFYIPLRGVLEGDKLKLRIEEATRDYEAAATAVYILVNPAVPFPHVMTQELAYQDGGFIVSRALDGDPEFDVVVHRDAGYSEIKKDFKRDATTPGGLAEVKWTASVHACSPRCP